MNFKQLLQLFVDDLSALYGDDEAKAMFGIVAAHISGLDRAGLILKSLDEPDSAAIVAYARVLQELKTGRPLQYVLGETVFFGLRFKVAPGVLIPRPETEELADWVLNSVPDGCSVLDVGTGSGCIAVSLKVNLPGSSIYALDVSVEALEIASANANLNQVVINFIREDIRTYITDLKFDVIVSNPPYVTLDEKEEMQQHVLVHEPHLALFVSNEDPLIFYRAIADFALSNLNRGGFLFFEINEVLGWEMLELLGSRGFSELELRKDMQGKDRMIRCRLI